LSVPPATATTAARAMAAHTGQRSTLGSSVMNTPPAVMNAPTEKSIPPASTTIVCPAPARPSSAAVTSIDISVDRVVQPGTVAAPTT
jgi:hypothetical protein